MNKYCRICLEEVNGVLTSIFNAEFAMMPSEMMMLCAKVKVYKNDGMPAGICNNCIYRLGVAYHFKQQCENSDLRLRQYFGLMDRYGTRDAEMNTDIPYPTAKTVFPSKDTDGTLVERRKIKYKSNSSRRYKRKEPEERKKRGPKPTEKAPQTCFECSKSFKCSAQLQMHIRTHNGDRPFACDFCPRRFAQKHNLTIHVRTHTGDRPYQCEICSKQFAALGNFQSHLKIHAGIRDQICPVCQKAFITSGDLSRHIATHTGIKNHQCTDCGKAFTRHRDMLVHKKKIHSGSTTATASDFKCMECHKEFGSSLELDDHFRTAHTTESAVVVAAEIATEVTTTSSVPPSAIPATITTAAGTAAALASHHQHTNHQHALHQHHHSHHHHHLQSNQPGTIEHMLALVPPPLPPPPPPSLTLVPSAATMGSSLSMLPHSGHGMIHHPSTSQHTGSLGMMHHHPHTQRIHPY